MFSKNVTKEVKILPFFRENGIRKNRKRVQSPTKTSPKSLYYGLFLFPSQKISLFVEGMGNEW